MRDSAMWIEIIYTAGGRELFKREEKLKLKEMQNIVGGPIEYVPMPKDYPFDIVVNEEGWDLQLPINARATELVCKAWLERHDASELNLNMLVVCGTAIVIGADHH